MSTDSPEYELGPEAPIHEQAILDILTHYYLGEYELTGDPKFPIIENKDGEEIFHCSWIKYEKIKPTPGGVAQKIGVIMDPTNMTDPINYPESTEKIPGLGTLYHLLLAYRMQTEDNVTMWADNTLTDSGEALWERLHRLELVTYNRQFSRYKFKRLDSGRFQDIAKKAQTRAEILRGQTSIEETIQDIQARLQSLT